MQCVLAGLTCFGLMWAVPSLRGLYQAGHQGAQSCDEGAGVGAGVGVGVGTGTGVSDGEVMVSV